MSSSDVGFEVNGRLPLEPRAGSPTPHRPQHLKVHPPGIVAVREVHGPHTPVGVRPSICFYTPSADPSGMGAHILDLIGQYAGNHAVSLMCRPTDGGRQVLERASRLGAVVLPLPRPRDPAFGHVVNRFLEAHRPDVFHCHVGIGWEGWGGVSPARRAGVPAVVQTQHLPFLLSHPRKRRGFLSSIEGADRLIAVSDGVRRTYERIGVPPALMTTIANGVRPRGSGAGRHAAREILGLADDQPVVMTVGRLAQMKGHRHLIDCIPGLLVRHPRLAVVIVGDGPLRGRLEARVAALAIDGVVHFTGQRADARRLLDAADLFVLPSRYEGMPLAAIEAMDAGLPVVATRVIGSEEVVADGETGMLVRSEDATALGAAIAHLLSDADLRARYGRAGRQRYLTRFTAQRMATDTAAVYDAALGAAAAAPQRTRQ